jgi:SAM-dependent methyltransferase
MKADSMVRDSSLERIVPDRIRPGDVTGSDTLKLHLQRYEFAAGYLGGKRILDVACGVGYGTHFLATRFPNAEVTGVDLSGDAIAYARSRYRLPNLRFMAADAMVYQGDTCFDSVISLETIEHLPAPERFIGRVAGALIAPGGIFVGSVPVTPSVDANPHHLTDFTKRSFRQLLAGHGFQEIGQFEQVQPYDPFAVAMRTENRMQGMRPNLLRYYAANPGKLMLRVRSVLVDGFQYKYLTLACRHLHQG